jgi:hypothetical protein
VPAPKPQPLDETDKLYVWCVVRLSNSAVSAGEKHHQTAKSLVHAARIVQQQGGNANRHILNTVRHTKSAFSRHIRQLVILERLTK